MAALSLRAHAPHSHAPHSHDTQVAFEYHAELGTCELIAELLRLLRIERGAERLVCRYLADLADRAQWRRELMLYRHRDEMHAARCCFGLGPREARERVRIGRALRRLPEIERALVEGELSYSRVREITRVATADTEAQWIELARQLDMRTLERRVARAQAGAADDADAGAAPITRRVTFELSEAACEMLERALAEVRRANAEDYSDGEALEVVARVALAAQGRPLGQPINRTSEAATASMGAAATAGAAPSTATTESTAASMKEAALAGAMPVRAWSWDDLGWLATQSGSRSERNHPRATARPSQNTTERASHADRRPSCQNTAERGSHADRHSNCSTQDDVDRSNQILTSQPLAHPSSNDNAYRADRDAADVAGAEDAEDARWADGEADESERERSVEGDEWGEINSRLLQAMGGRGRWNADSLIEATGLSAREVNTALTYLELGGRIRRRQDAFEPI